VGTEFTNNDQYACVDVSWLGTLRAPVTVTVTGVVVVEGPFEPVDMATAGCSANAPPCAGLTITAASDSGTQCIAAVRSTGRALNGGSVELAGSLSCHGLGPAACQQVVGKVKSDVLANGPVQFDFPVPPVTDTTSPPGTDTTSPAAGTTSSASDTTSPPASETTSPAPADTSSS
jgi:cell division septation protein DedD